MPACFAWPIYELDVCSDPLGRSHGTEKVATSKNGIFYPLVVIDGRVVGVWKRAFKRDDVIITFTPFRSWTDAEQEAVWRAAEGYAGFLQKTLRLIEAG